MKNLLSTTALVMFFLVNSQIFAQTNQYDFSKVDQTINDAIKDSSFPGAQLLVWQNDKTIYNKSYGHLTYDPKSPEVTAKTLYDLASVTKVIATTTAAMICYDRKLFSIDDPVIKYIPEFAINGKDKITIKNLLLHNSGLPAYKRFYQFCSSKEEVIKEIFSSELEYPTGEKMVYSDLGIITLGKIIERVTGKNLDTFCEDEIFGPLGMKNTFYTPSDSFTKLCAPTEIDDYWRKKLLQGEVHDETSAMLGGVAGHAGLFSNTTDLSKFLTMIINLGNYNGKQLINPETVKLFTTRYSESSSRALGWDTKSEKGSSSGDYFSPNSFGHTGFTGTSVWIDPVRKLFVIFLTNRVYPTRENSKIRTVRPEVHNEIIKAIEQN